MELTSYLIVAAVVFRVNLLPAFGPPTWSVLVFYRLNGHLAVVALVLIGATAAAAGRLGLAVAFSHLRGHVSTRQTANLQAAGKVLSRDRKRSSAGLALFALSPLSSAQLFEAAGLIGVALVPLTAAFFLGRLVSYEWLAEQVLESGGTAGVWLVRPGTLTQERQLAMAMAAARGAEYVELVEAATATLSGVVSERDKAVGRLRRQWREVTRRDFFPPPEREVAAAALRALSQASVSGAAIRAAEVSR